MSCAWKRHFKVTLPTSSSGAELAPPTCPHMRERHQERIPNAPRNLFVVRQGHRIASSQQGTHEDNLLNFERNLQRLRVSYNEDPRRNGDYVASGYRPRNLNSFHAKGRSRRASRPTPPDILAYSRTDRNTQFRDPTSNRLLTIRPNEVLRSVTQTVRRYFPDQLRKTHGSLVTRP